MDNDMQPFERWESNVRGYCRLAPTVFCKAQNAKQWDENGKAYIDFFAGAGVLNFGHNNQRMKEAIIAFLERDGVVHSLDMYSDVKRRFIQRFTEVILEPRGMDYRLQFTGPTGTNAVEAALKLARKVTGRQSVIAFTHGFHGMTLGSLACTANGKFRKAAGVPLDNVHRVSFEGHMGAGVDDIRELSCALKDASSGIDLPAAILVEPIQAEGGVNVASKEWLHAVQELAREHGALFILDDIQAGCGRTGSYFSFDGMDLDPDVVTLAKGLGGFGTPIGMNMIKPEHDKWQPGEHTGTFRGQGLSFVAGAEAMSYFEDDELMSEVRRKGEVMRERLQAIADKHPDLGFAVRGRGMMQALDTMDGDLTSRAAKHGFENGMLIGPCGPAGRVMKCIPPLTIPDDELAEGLDILERAITATISEGVKS